MADQSFKDLAYRGLAAALGGPVDLSTMFLRAIGYTTPEKEVVGGSEWLGQQMERAGLVSSARAPIAELLASLPIGAPGATAKLAAAGGAGLAGIAAQMARGIKSGQSVPQRMGQSGQIAWHGSPHKFDAFSLDKIGTGEGAQAYGHGLYLAESPEVATAYRDTLSATQRQWFVDGKRVEPGLMNAFEQNVLHAKQYGRKKQEYLEQMELDGVKKPAIDELGRVWDSMGEVVTKDVPAGNASLYKTDIPDEAVARFLDWDKPLSQQAPAVQAAIFKDIDSAIGQTQEAMKTASPRRLPTTTAELEKLQRERNRLSSLTGGDYYLQASLGETKGQPNATNAVQNLGIPGIRYLDGGSRSAGQGSSNFVIFDPEMIRILERNGMPTGAVPWIPGEWRGLSSR
jgi:hypothetical protein